MPKRVQKTLNAAFAWKNCDLFQTSSLDENCNAIKLYSFQQEHSKFVCVCVHTTQKNMRYTVLFLAHAKWFIITDQAQLGRRDSI